MDGLSPDVPFAEKALVGALIDTDGAGIDELTVTGQDFADPRLGDLFDTILRARVSGHHATYATLMDAHPNYSALIAELGAGFGLLAYAIAEHASIVAKNALRRRLRAAAAGLEQRAQNPDLDEDTLIEQARALVDVAVGEPRRSLRFLRDVVPDVIDRIEAGGQFVPSPWPSLDKAIGGFRPGCVYVIGARPAVGKTVVAGQCAVALAQHGPVAFSSLEMSDTELAARFISERALIHVTRVKDGTMTPTDWERFAERRARVDGLPIAIDDRASVTAADVRQFARSVGRHGPLAGVVVDYLQLMSPTNARAERQQQITEASRLLKVMAKDLSTPVILLSQLNRETEKRSDPTPKLSDLRESGAIEQDADVVIFLTREKEMGREKLVLEIAKNRHGETATVELVWQGAVSRAVEWKDA